MVADTGPSSSDTDSNSEPAFSNVPLFDSNHAHLSDSNILLSSADDVSSLPALPPTASAAMQNSSIPAMAYNFSRVLQSSQLGL